LKKTDIIKRVALTSENYEALVANAPAEASNDELMETMSGKINEALDFYRTLPKSVRVRLAFLLVASKTIAEKDVTQEIVKAINDITVSLLNDDEEVTEVIESDND
jgi:hypothetical protein